MNSKDLPKYQYLPSSIYYYSVNNVGSFVSDPEFYSLWNGYDPNVLGMPSDPMFLLGKMKNEGLDLRGKLQGCIDRAYFTKPGINVCDVLRVQAEQQEGVTYRDNYFHQLSFVRDRIQSKKYNAKNDPTFDLASIYGDFYDIPSEVQYKAAADMSKKENYYCLLRALYDVGSMQGQNLGNDKNEYPISMNIYPSEMKDMVVALANKMFGENATSITDGKDFGFVSFMDNLGRGEVMMFYDTSELLVPTSFEMNSYCSNIETIMKANPDPYRMEHAKKMMKTRDYDSNVYDFVDGTYGLRTVMAAIKSIAENKIQSQNENVSFHPLSEIINKYPILTEVAKDRNVFFEKLDELSIVTKNIQAEYDARNFKKACFRSLDQSDSFARSFIESGFRNKYIKATPDVMLADSLTEEEKTMFHNVMSKGGNTANVPVVDTVGMQVSNLDSIWLNTLCDMAKAKIDGMGKDAVFSDALAALDNSRIFEQFYPIALKNVPIDFAKIQGGEHSKEIAFLQELLNMESFEPMNVVNEFVKGIEVTPENKQAIETIKATVINDVYDYNLSHMKEKNKTMYHNLVKKLFIAKIVASNLRVMSNTNKYPNQIEVPTMYRDLSPLVDYCHHEIENASMEGKTSDECRDVVINNLNSQGEMETLVSPTSIRTEKNSLTDYIDYVMEISLGDDKSVDAMNDRKDKIGSLLQDVISDDAKRDEISKVWGFYGPEILKGVSPEVLPLLVADFEVARSGLAMDNKVVSNDVGKKL